MDISQVPTDELLAALRMGKPKEPGDIQTVSTDDLRAAVGLPPRTASTTATGLLKAAGTGALEGAAGVAGLPADLAALGARGIDYLRGTDTASEAIKPLSDVAGNENLKRIIEHYMGPLYQPQTGAEQAVRNVAGFLPGMALGPGGVGRRLAANVLAPGVASEVAGQATAGTAAEPYARVAGALGGAVAGSLAGSRAAARAAVPAVPTHEQTAAAVAPAYNTPALQSARIDPRFAASTADQITSQLRQQRFSRVDPQINTVYGIVDDLRAPQFGPVHTVQDFDGVRRQLNGYLGQGPAGAAARVAINGIDNALENLPTSAIIGGDARQAVADLGRARALAAAEFRSQRVEDWLEKARNTAAATHSGGNLENEVYKQIRSALNERPMRQLRGWSPEEVTALRDVLPGIGSSILRRTGKIFGGGGGLGMLGSAAAGAHALGPLGAPLFPAIGYLANQAGAMGAVNRLQRVGDLVRSRSPLYGPQAQAARQAALQGGILQGQYLPPRELALLEAAMAARIPPALQAPQEARY